MSVQAQPALPESFVEIRTLHILSGDGQAVDFRSVRCPTQRRAMTLEQCLSCAESGRLAPVARTERVVCRAAGPGEALAAPAARSADALAAAVQTAVSSVMTTEVLAVRPDVSLEVVAELFLERGIGGAPVVDADGRPVGVISGTDLVAERFIAGDTGEALGPGRQVSRGRYRVEVGPGFHAEALPNVSVADAMTRATYHMPENGPIAQAAGLMASRGVHRVLVVSEDGRVAGIVTSTDIMRWLAQQGGYVRPEATSVSSAAATPEA